MNLRWYLNRRLGPELRTLYDKLTTPPTPNDLGHRDIEYSYIAAHMPNGPGLALDFGCGNSWMGLLAARKGFKTVGIDLTKPNWYYEHPLLNFATTLPLARPSLVLNCSVIENLGVGRYKDDLSDARAMKLLRDVMLPGATTLLTTQVGIPKVIPKVHKIYGSEQLKELFGGLTLKNSEYWIKDKDNIWIQVHEATAYEVEGNERYYALGLFTLVKK